MNSNPGLLEGLPGFAGPCPLYRSTFLELRLSPAQRAAWRATGNAIYRRLLADSPATAFCTASFTLRPSLRAVAEDLEFLAEFLRSLGDGAELPPRDQGLQALAAQGARQLSAVATGLKTAALRPSGNPWP